MSRPPGILGLNAKLADAAPHARVTLAALVELLGRDDPLRRELYAAVERSAGFMFWPRLIMRPVLFPQDAPRIAPGRAEQSARPNAPPVPERVLQSAPGAAPVPGAAVLAAPVVGAAAASPRRGALPRRAAALAGDASMGELQALVAQRLGAAS